MVSPCFDCSAVRVPAPASTSPFREGVSPFSNPLPGLLSPPFHACPSLLLCYCPLFSPCLARLVPNFTHTSGLPLFICQGTAPGLDCPRANFPRSYLQESCASVYPFSIPHRGGTGSGDIPACDGSILTRGISPLQLLKWPKFGIFFTSYRKIKQKLRRKHGRISD